MSSTDISGPERGEEVRLFRASHAQARMWYAHRHDPDNPGYNVFLAAHVRGLVDGDVLAAALHDVVARHEPLRTTFTEVESELHQVVGDIVHVPLTHETVSPEVLDEALRDASVRPFDLATGPLVRAHLFTTAPRDHTLLLVLHHVVVDGWSLEVLFRELGDAYRARSTGTEPVWAPLELQYADIVEWELDRFAEGAEDSGIDYWRRTLTPPPPPLALPVDRLRTDPPRADAGRTPLLLSAEVSDRLRHLARSHSTTLSSVLLTAYAALLRRWCDTPDLVIGTPSAGRTRSETEDMVGLFVNTLPVRCRLHGDPTFMDALGTVREAALNAFQYQSVPLDMVVEAVRPRRMPGRSPLFDVLFTLQNTADVTLDLPDSETRWVEVDTSWTRFDLEVNFWDEPAVRGLLIHRGSLLSVETARAVADALLRLVEAAAFDPWAPLSTLLPDDALPTGPQTDDPARAAAEHAVLDLPGVAEAVVLPVTGPGGADERTVFAVPEAPLTEERVLTAARQAAPSLVFTGVALLAGLPRLSDGRLDTSSLSEVAVIDPGALRSWGAELRQSHPNTQIRVIDAPAPEPTTLYAPDPARTRLEQGAIATSAPTDGRGTVPPAVSADTSAAELTASLPDPDGSGDAGRGGVVRVGEDRPGESFPAVGPLSVSDGGPPPPLKYTDLGAALEAAATGEHGVTFVDPKGNRSHLTYRDLYSHALAVLGGLRGQGLESGDRVLLPFRDNQSLVPMLWACLLGGIVAVPWSLPTDPDTGLSARLRTVWEKLDQPLIAASEVLAGELCPVAPEGAAVVTDVGLVAGVAGVAASEPSRVPLGGDALLLLTSGSTGAPKAVRVTHRMVLTRSTAALGVCDVDADDVSLNWMPLDHVGGVVMFHIRDVVAGCRQIQAATPWVLADPLRWIDLTHEFGVTTTWAPNFAFGLVADEVVRRGGAWDLRGLRHILNGGEAVVARTARAFLRALAPHGLPAGALRPAWGMSETTSGETDNAEFRLDTTADDDTTVVVGRPYPGFCLRIVDAHGTVPPEGVVGRLQVRGDAVTPGYVNDPERDAAAFTSDGWFETGDLAMLREGRLTITGRFKDDVVVNGVNHHCHDIESAVEDHAPVLRSYTAAVGLPDSDHGEHLAVLFVPNDEADTDTTCTRVREAVRLGTGLNPHLLIPVRPEDIPKTGIGKVQRARLRDRLESGAFDAAITRASAHNRTADTLPNWFHRPAWHQEARLHTTASVRRVLLVAPDTPRVRALASALEVSGARVHSVAEPTELSEALADPVERIVVVDEGADPGPDARSNARIAVSGAEAYRSLLRTIHERHAASPTTVAVVATGVLDAPGGDVPRITTRVLPGLIRSAAQELPGTACRLLDTTNDTPPSEIAAEVLSDERGNQVALRPGARWVSRLAPATPGEAWTPHPRDGILITGGLGGLGVHLAHTLLAGYGAKVLLTGRGEPDREQRATLEDLRQRYGTERVHYAACDCTDASALSATVAAAEAQWAAPLAGAFHLAGDFAEQPLTGSDDTEFARLLTTKMVGLGALSDLIDDRPGAALVAFSSVNGFLGAASSAAYAAANSFLDGWATAADTNARGPRRSLGWSMWDETGLSRGYALKERTHERGSRILTPDEGRRSLAVALRTTDPHVLIGLDQSRPWVRAHSRPQALPLRTTAVSGAPPTADHQWLVDRHGIPVPVIAEERDPYQDPSPTRPRNELERLVARTWREVLGVEDLAMDDAFFDLGGASLQMSRVHGLLQTRLEREIDMVDLFRHPTVAAVAAFLSRTEPSPAVGTDAANRGRDRAAARRARRGRRQ